MGDISKEVTADVKRPGFSSAEYNSAAKIADLAGISLLSNRFSVRPDAVEREAELKLSHGRKVMSCGFDADTNSVVAIFQYNVQGKLGKSKALECTAEFAVMYTFSEDVAEEAAIGFCRNVGRFAAYPYFRSLVASLTWNAGITLPPLPSIASTAHIPKKKEKQNDVVDL